MRNFSALASLMAQVIIMNAASYVLAISILLSNYSYAYADNSNKNPAPEIARTNIEHRINMAQRLIENERYNEAIRNLKTTVKRYRYNADAWSLLGFAHRQSDDIHAANAAYTRALRLNRYHLGALQYQGELFIAMGRLNDAKINLRQMNELCPSGCKEQQELEAAISKAN